MALPTTTYDTATVLNPSSALTNFTLMVDLSRMSAAWWAAVDTTQGRRGRAAKDDGTELACDWIDFDSVAETGWLRVKWSGTLASSGTQVLRVYPPNTANSVQISSSTYGKDNAYKASAEGYWPMMADADDRTVNGRDFILTAGVVPGGGSTNAGPSASFDGVGYGQNNDNPFENAAERTLMIWGKPVTGFATGDGLFNIGLPYGSGGQRWTFTTSGGTPAAVRIEVGGGGYTSSKTTPLDEWNFFGVSLSDGGDLSGHKIYKNDEAPETATGTTTINTLITNNLYIGLSYLTTKGWVGDLQHAMLYSEELPEAWIDHEYAQTSGQAAFWGTWANTAGASATTTSRSRDRSRTRAR